MALSFRYQPSPDLNPSPHPIIPPDHPHDQPYHPPPPTPSPLPSPPPGAGIQGDWYVYQPLPSSNHIRLLELKESSSPPGFECSLQIVDLDTELLSYEALSYTWGCHWYTSGYKNRPPTERDRERDAQRSTILCDGKLIWIRLNLYNALGRLFKTRGENQTQTYPKLWVDAICINQEDLDERAQQVALMGNIYASATRVIAWLGECDSDNAEVKDFIWVHTISVPAMKAEMQRREDWPPQASKELDYNLRRVGQFPSFENWRYVWDIYSNIYLTCSYFYRGWIAQEIALGKEITVMYGPYTLNWSLFVDVAFLLHWTAWDKSTMGPWVYPFSPEKSSGYAIRDLESLRGLREHDNSYSRQIHGLALGAGDHSWWLCLEQLLGTLRWRHLSLPHDKIYAALGVTSKFFEKPGGAEIRVDYRMPVEELYLSVATQLVENLPTLSMLSFLGNTAEKTYKTLPSWVPDFSRPLLESLLVFSSFSERFDASYVGRPFWRPRVIGSVLSVLGLRIDTVRHISAPLELFTPYATDSEEITSLLNLYPNIAYPYVDGSTPLEALTGALVADGGWRKFPPQVQYLVRFLRWTYEILLKVMTKKGADTEHLRHLITATEILLQRDKYVDTEPSKGWSEPLEFLLEAIPSEERALESSWRASRRRYMPAQNPDEEWEDLEEETLAGLPSRFDGRFSGFKGFWISISREVWIGKRAFVTAKGYVGIGSIALGEGDQIWLLDGSRVFHILRPKGDAWQIVGEAYVHGFMFGEAMTKESVERWQEVRIV